MVFPVADAESTPLPDPVTDIVPALKLELDALIHPFAPLPEVAPMLKAEQVKFPLLVTVYEADAPVITLIVAMFVAITSEDIVAFLSKVQLPLVKVPVPLIVFGPVLNVTAPVPVCTPLTVYIPCITVPKLAVLKVPPALMVKFFMLTNPVVVTVCVFKIITSSSPSGRLVGTSLSDPATIVHVAAVP